jgi:hypothetical protein
MDYDLYTYVLDNLSLDKAQKNTTLGALVRLVSMDDFLERGMWTTGVHKWPGKDLDKDMLHFGRSTNRDLLVMIAYVLECMKYGSKTISIYRNAHGNMFINTGYYVIGKDDNSKAELLCNAAEMYYPEMRHMEGSTRWYLYTKDLRKDIRPVINGIHDYQSLYRAIANGTIIIESNPDSLVYYPMDDMLAEKITDAIYEIGSTPDDIEAIIPNTMGWQSLMMKSKANRLIQLVLDRYPPKCNKTIFGAIPSKMRDI